MDRYSAIPLFGRYDQWQDADSGSGEFERVSYYRSFVEQVVHYFMRPHERIPDGPVNHPANWHGPVMAARPELWLTELADGQITELESEARRLVAKGKTLYDVTRTDFVLPSWECSFSSWRETLGDGRGFLCLRGLPVERWRQETGDDTLASFAYWGIGHHLGIPGAQNPQDELLGHVINYDEEAGNPNVRRYRTDGNIDFHCDGADVVGLLCMHDAKEGGQSRIASSVAIYNELVTQRPDLAKLLFESFKLDRRGEQEAGMDSTVEIIPCTYAGNRLRTFWHSEYFRSAPQHQGVSDYSDPQKQLLDLYDAIAATPDIYLDMWLQPGDMQFISNHSLVHSRTAYEDWPERARRRHLLRLWLSL